MLVPWTRMETVRKKGLDPDTQVSPKELANRLNSRNKGMA